MKNSKQIQAVSPSDGYHGMPFWSWNGSLKLEELLRQVSIIKEMGFTGFFMHSRTGLKTEYLGEHWFACIRECAKEAKRLGLKAYIYDEDRWPSGTAGGLVTRNPKHRMKFIKLKFITPEQLDFTTLGQEFIAVFAVKLDDSNRLNDYYEIIDVSEVRQGFKVALFVVEEMQKDSFYNGYTYLDTLSREATEAFLKVTHELYKEKCGDMIGNEIEGVFVDEPHRGCMFGGFGITNAEAKYMTPYTYKLFDEFEKTNGYRLQDKLPELYFEQPENEFSKVSYDYVSVVQNMFIDNFAKPYHDWCKRNKLIVTGHILHEDSLSAQTAVSGSVMRYYEHMDYPGIDILSEGNKNYWVVKQCVSVARQTGSAYKLSELYGCTGWQFNFQSHKCTGDWQAVLGINFRCHHLSWYTMEGESKRDYPASIFYQSSWWDKYSYVENYYSRLNNFLSGEALAETLVLNPVESVWGYVHTGCFNRLSAAVPKIKALEDKYVSQFSSLMKEGVDFDYADEDFLARTYRIEKGLIFVGKATYRTVLVSGMEHIRKTTLKALQEFKRSGGNVIFCGTPRYCSGEKLVDFSGFEFAATEADAAGLCASKTLFKANVSEDKIMFSIKRIDNAKYHAVFINLDRENSKNGVKITVNQSLYAKEYNVRDGSEHFCNFKKSNESIEIYTDFAKGQERAFILTDERQECVAAADIDCEVIIPTSLKYSLNEPNILVLDTVDYYVNGELCGRDEVLKADRKIREMHGIDVRGGYMVQPWYRDKYLSDSERVACSARLIYRFNIDVMPEDMALVCETPEKFKISINSKKIQYKDTGEFFIDNSFKVLPIDIKKLVKGENQISFEFDMTTSLDLEACYLKGAFGVKIGSDNICTIIKLPLQLDETPLAMQGLPFYSGKISFETDIIDETIRVEFADIKCAYAEVDFGSETEMVAFSPYTTKFRHADKRLSYTCCLTRRNTFGPLHLPNPVQSAYGPSHFITSGKEFSKDYSFYDEKIVFPIIYRPTKKQRLNTNNIKNKKMEIIK